MHYGIISTHADKYDIQQGRWRVSTPWARTRLSPPYPRSTAQLDDEDRAAGIKITSPMQVL